MILLIIYLLSFLSGSSAQFTISELCVLLFMAKGFTEWGSIWADLVNLVQDFSLEFNRVAKQK